MTTSRDFPREALERILSAGILAPSADNHHLFRFTVLDDRILIKVSDTYRLAASQTKVLAWISYGAVVENMRLQATQFGWVAETTWFPLEDVVCEFRLIRSGGTADPLVDAIPSRHTNRRLLYSGPPLRAAEQTELENQLLAAEGVRLTWLDTAASRRRALRFLRLAESERFRSHSLHAELFSALRFDVGYKASCEQGIPIGAAEIELLARPLFALMRHWPMMRVLNLIRTDWLVGWRAAYFPARLSPHLGLITADGDIRTAATQAGRGLERLWLRANQMGLALQPLAAGPLYALSEFDGVSTELRHELKEGWAALAPRGTPLMLFRLGHAAAPSVRAGRPPLSSFLEPTSSPANLH